MKNKVILFTNNNARLIRTNELSTWEKDPRALINPDLSKVKGIPPHFWKRDGGQIVPMTDQEKVERLANIEKHGIHNNYTLAPVTKKEHKRVNVRRMIELGVSFIVGIVVGGYLI